MTLYKWSQTASADATADSTINWAEGQAPSSINDSARAMMAAVAKYRDDNAPNLQTGGTSTAYTLATNQVFDSLAHMATQEMAFFINLTNGANPTLNVDGLGPFPIVTSVFPLTPVPPASLLALSVYTVVFSNASSCFVLKGFFGNPFNIPIGGGMDYWGATVPNSNFAFPIGQAISRTTYATLFAIIGTTYGSGDGSTTFNLPDKTGRVSAMKEASATRLTTGVGGVDGATLGAVAPAGAQGQNLTIANINSFTPTVASATIAVTGNINVPVQGNTGSGVLNAVRFGSNDTSITSISVTGTTLGGTATVTMNALGSGTAHANVQPTIVCNYIMRII